ncbi:hypothetical protein [Roseiconus lacunae]|uniref:hypothetical protein n=1 Tax=Roseiconus lacunae TaxID=2605694 RepID=UPI0013589B06|nr:hypothetical protein [Roseiconus lacunae]
MRLHSGWNEICLVKPMPIELVERSATCIAAIAAIAVITLWFAQKNDDHTGVIY